MKGDKARRLFPRGIEQIHIGIEPGGTVSVKLAGPGAAVLTAAPVAAHIDDLHIGDKVPNEAERLAVGATTDVIKRDTPAFDALTRNGNADVAFKDEEGTGADRMMTAKLSAKVDALAALVKLEWAGTKLRITEAWDENMEHGLHSIHYEARAADLTTSPVDGSKLGRLARLAVTAGFEWVFYENALHVHVSMSK